jgi:hypothetical protein
MENFDITFQIISTDIDNDSIIVRPWSSQYKNALSSYPTYNINISNLSTAEDINTQIARVCSSVVRSTLIKESTAFNAIIDYLNVNINTVYSVPVSATLQTFTTVLTTQTDSPSSVNFIA